MAPRVLVCLEDTGVSHVIAARLVRDGAEGIVVDKPAKLADEARKGAVALVVQDRYPSGEVGSSLLRQVRVARGEVIAAVVVVTGELAAPDRHVLEKQYKVQSFLPASASPVQIADALKNAGALTGPDLTGLGVASGTMEGAPATQSGEEDLVLHEDEVKNEFDISIESQAAQIDRAFEGAFDDDDGDMTLKTVEISQAELMKLKANGATRSEVLATSPEMGLPTRRVHDEVTNNGPTLMLEADDIVDTGGDLLSQLPAPGGDNDFDLQPKPTLTTSPSPLSAAQAWPAAPASPSPAATPAAPSPSKRFNTNGSAGTSSGTGSGTGSSPPTNSPAFSTPSDVSMGMATANPVEGDAMQIQELQRTQAELKKALLAERKARETAQKRVEELESKLQKMGEAPSSTGIGVPTDGVFEDLRYPALLARCRSEAFTGSIVMQSGGATRSVYLKDGLPVAFSSSEPGQRIGKVLVSQGRITDEQYMKAATRMVEKSIKLTDALVELNLIDGESLAVEQRNLTRDQIIQGFEIVQGRFTTTPGAAPDGNAATFDFGPGEIYVQGYRRYAPPNEMLAAYETLRDKYLIANARLAGFRPKLGLTSEDERLLRLLGEALTVEEAVERANLTAEHCARLLSALQALDLVEEWSPGVEQFRSRIRAEKQRTAEELQALHVEHKRREDRLLDAFERALGGGGVASLREAAGSNGSSSSQLSPSMSSMSGPSLSADRGEAISFGKPEPKKPEPKKAEPPPPQPAPKPEPKAPLSSLASTLNAASSRSFCSRNATWPEGLPRHDDSRQGDRQVLIDPSDGHVARPSYQSENRTDEACI